MGDVLLIRHGQAGFGRVNYDELSDRGHIQARVTGDAWRGLISATAMVSGEMRRHLETATGFSGDETSLPPLRIDPDLNEYAHEAVLRAYRPELVGRDAISTWLASQKRPRAAFRAAFQGAVERWIACGDDGQDAYPEAFQNFRERTERALERLRPAASQPGNVVVFTSGGVISALVMAAMAIPDGRAFFELSAELINASVTRLRPVPGGWRLVSFNGHHHLLGHEPSLLTHL